MTIIAFDPSTTRMGICWLYDEQTYHAHSIRLDGEGRDGLLARMLRALQALPSIANVNAVYVESAGSFYGKGRTSYATLSKLAMMRGAILGHYLTNRVTTVALVDVSTVRAALCGKASAGKGEVQTALRQAGFDLSDDGGKIDDDAWDALALAVWAYRKNLP